MPLRRSLPLAGQLGAAGLELDAVGDFAPGNLSQSARRELRHLFRSHQVELAAIACPLRHGLDVAEQQEARIDYLRQAMSMSFELGCRIVVAQPGPLPADENDPRRRLLTEALTALGHHGDRVGATLAIETGLEPPELLETFLARLDTGGLAVTFNPGTLLVHGHDPYAAVRLFKARMIYVHATDARRAVSAHLARRVPVGRGDIDWLQLIAAFAEVDYRGYVTLDVEPGASAQTDAAAGLAFLKRLLM